MKAVIIGNGHIAGTHAEAIRLAGYEPSWVVGSSAARTASFAEAHQIQNYTTSLEDALTSDAEIVHICTPPYNHAEIIRKCLSAGKHIICEKPLCINPTEALTLAKEAASAYKEKNLITAICYNVRFYPTNINISKEIKEEKRDCKVLFGSYLQEFHIPPHPDGWRFDNNLSGSMRAITEIGTHWIDLSYAWTGLKISEVSAVLGNWFPVRYIKDGMLTEDASGEARAIESEDTAAIIMKFENGAIGTLLLSETSPGHSNDLTIEVTDLKKTYRWKESSEKDRTATFTALFREVYDSVKTGRRGDFPDFEDGAYVAAVCDAIRKSGEIHTWVKVNL